MRLMSHLFKKVMGTSVKMSAELLLLDDHP